MWDAQHVNDLARIIVEGLGVILLIVKMMRTERRVGENRGRIEEVKEQVKELKNGNGQAGH